MDKIPRWEPAPPTYRIVTENHIGGTYKNGQKTNVNLNVGDIGIVIAEHEIARSKILMNFTSLPGQSVYVERDKSRELTTAEAAAAAEAESLRGKTFAVKRSSGKVEPGWHLGENENIKFDTVSGEVEVTCTNDESIMSSPITYNEYVRRHHADVTNNEKDKLLSESEFNEFTHDDKLYLANPHLEEWDYERPDSDNPLPVFVSSNPFGKKKIDGRGGNRRRTRNVKSSTKRRTRKMRRTRRRMIRK